MLERAPRRGGAGESAQSGGQGNADALAGVSWAAKEKGEAVERLAKHPQAALRTV